METRGRRVLKFGGAALADGPAIGRVARIVAREAEGPGGPPVVVVSACAGVTDLLEAVAHGAARGRSEGERVRVRHRTLLAQLGLPSELLDRYWRELEALLAQVRAAARLAPGQLDQALSFGERLSARLVARVLEREGLSATPVDAWDLGLVSDSNHGRARPLEGSEEAVRAALAEIGGVPVVTGFLAVDRRGRLTTLGRDGSDLTASLVAAAIGAAELVFHKPVPGILTADPELVPEARLLEAVSHAEAEALAFHGARVLHPAALEPALRARLRVRLCDVRRPSAPGTLLVPELEREGPVALAARRDLLRVDLAVAACERHAPALARLAETLEACGVESAGLETAAGRASAYVTAGPGVPAALGVLGPRAGVVRDLAGLAVVGHGVAGRRSIGARALEVLEDGRVPVLGAALGALRDGQAFVLPAETLERAARLLHDALLARAPAGVGRAADN